MITYIIIGLFITLLHNLFDSHKHKDPEDKAFGIMFSVLFWPVVVLVFIYKFLVGFFKALDKKHSGH